MSKTIDQRVVEMRFDNKHFENNVQTSMSTLEKLKQSLNFSGAHKSLDGLNKAANNVNMSGLGGAVETVSAKFSAMQVIGVTALANITNSAVNAGKRMISALTIDPVKTGFQEYETQINSVQTILANTSHAGTSIDDVNKALDELNTYADETIYNFTEMTRNIGTFTAAGVDLKTSVSSIKGIANLAAVSGSTSQQASTAMYQLSQALAAGKVSLMDWNSVVNAGMGGKVFQDALIRTSELLGTGAKAAIDTYGSFRESLTKGEWLTTEVLTETLQQFAGAYSEADLIAQGFTEEQAKEISKMAETAKSAATDVKTFTQLWDVMKESAQSGWSQTWKLLIGDMEEAKKLLSPIADFFTGENGIITRLSNARNTIVQGVVDIAAPWKQIISKLEGSGLGKFKEVAEHITEAGDKLNYFQDVVNKVWRGDYKNSDTGRYQLLDAAGYDHRVVQDLVNKGYQYKITVEDIEASHKKFGLTMSTTSENTSGMVTALASLTDEQLKNAGLTEDEISLFRALAKEADKAGISIEELVKRMSEEDGRTLLIDSFKNIGKSFIELAGVIKDAWTEIFNPPSSGEVIVTLYGMIRSFNEFTKKLSIVNSETGELTETGEKLKRIFKGVFAVFDLVASVTGGALKIAFKIVAGLLKEFGIDALDAVAALADGVVTFRDWVKESLGFSDAIDGIVKILAKGIKAVHSWLKAFKETETFTNIIGYFKDTGKAIRDWISGIKDAENIPKYIIEGLAKGLINGVKKVWNAAIEIGKAVLNAVKSFLGIHSPSTVFMAIGGFIISGLVLGLLSNIPSVQEALQKLLSKCTEIFGNIDWGGIFAAGSAVGLTASVIKIANVFSALTAPIEGVGDLLSGVGEVLEKSAKPIAKVLKNTAKVVKSFANVMNSIAFKKNTEGIRNIAISLGILVAAIAVLAFIDIDKLWGAVQVVIALATVLGVLSILAAKINESSVDIGKEGVSVKGLSSGLVGIAASVLMLGIILKVIGSMDPDQIKYGLAAIGTIAVGLLLFVLALAGIGKIKTNKIEDVGSNLLKVAGAIAVLALVAKLMSKMTWGEFAKAAAGMGLLVGCIAILMVIGMIPSKQIDNLGSNILKISGSIAILALVAKFMSKMTWGEFGKAAAGMGLLIGCVALLMVIGMIPGKQIDNLGSNILKISGGIALLAIAAKLLGSMEWGELGKAAAGIIGLTAIMAALIYITRFAGGNDLTKVGTTILMISVSIGILAGVLTLLGLLKLSHIGKGILAVGALSILMAVLIKATKDAKDCKANLIVMTVAIGVMAAAVASLSLIDPTRLAVATGAMSLLMGMFALMVFASSKAKKSIKSIITITVVVGLLGVLIGVLANKIKDPEAALAAAGSISILLGVMAGVLIALAKAGKVGTKGTQKAIKNMLLLSGVVAVLGAILTVMSLLDVQTSIGNVAALSILLGVMTGALIALTTIGKANTKGAKTAITNMLLLSGVVVVLGAILTVMSLLDVQSSIGNVAALSILLGVMTGVLIALTTIGKVNTKGAKAAVTNMLLLSGVVAVLGAILTVMSLLDVQSSMANVAALSILLGVMAGVLIALTLVGTVAKQGAVAGVGAMALLGLVVAELALILGLMSKFDVNPSIETVAALSLLLISMSGALILLGAVGAMGPAAFIGIGALATLITGIGALIIGIGALMEKFPTLEEFLNKGIPIIEKIGHAIGSFFGNIVGGFMEGVSGALPNIATDLSNFMTNLQPFIEGAKNISSDVIAGIGYLSGAIIALTVADLIKGIGDFLTFGSSLSDLGTELSLFMLNAMPFMIGAASINPEMLAGVESLAKTILILTAANVLEGLTSWFTGGSSLASFGEQLPQLATDINAFATNLGTFDESKVATVTCAANAIQALAAAANTIPNEGGLWAKLVGDNSLATFGSYLPALGANINSFASSLGTFDETKVAIVKYAADAIKVLAEAADTIPNEGGLWASIVGDNSLATFGDQLPGLGTNLCGFATNLGTFDESKVATFTCAANAIKNMADAAKLIPNEGGLWAAIVGDNSLAKFGNQLPGLGINLCAFANNLGTFDSSKVTTVTCAANAIKALADTAKLLPDGQAEWAKKIFGDNSLEGFSSQFGTLGTNLASFVENLGTFTSAEVATIGAAVQAIAIFATLGQMDLKSISGKIGDFGDHMIDFGTDLCDFTDEMPTLKSMENAATSINKILDVVRSISKSDGKTAEDFGEALKTMGKNGVESFVKAFTSEATNTFTKLAAVNFVNQIVKGIEGAKKLLLKAGLDAGKQAASGADDAKSEFYDAGSDLVSGFASGISENSYKAAAKAKAMAEAAAEAAKQALKINSPSKIFMAIGTSIPEGFAMGIDKLGGSIKDSTIGMADTAITGISRSISRISDIVNTDIDSQPTIRPVLDMTDIVSGAGMINDLFNDTSIGVLGRVGGISSSMNNRNKNRGDTEVVSAINRLRAELGSLHGDSYVINGVTYDDGSAVSEAIKTITKAAIRERRT